MVGVITCLGELGFPSSIVTLIGSFRYIEAPANNDDIFKYFERFIEKFVYAKVFCRAHNVEFSIALMSHVEDIQFERSGEFIDHYTHSLDTTHYKQLVYTPIVYLNDAYPDPDDRYSPRNAMISRSHSLARTLAFSPFQLKFQFWCRACLQPPFETYTDYTIADMIDNGQIATACIKHR
jgi:hypothetical protein